jgi:tRNA A58 N-methylase Trm61
MEDFERGPQVILPKDSAFIVQMCEAGEGKRILEAGVGSGWLTAYMSYSVAPD